MDSPSPHNADIKRLFHLYVALCDILSLMTSSSLGPMIYLRDAKLQILIYGGLGHHPLLIEELMLFGVLMDFIAYLCVLMENTSTLGHFICLHFAIVDVKYHLSLSSKT